MKLYVNQSKSNSSEHSNSISQSDEEQENSQEVENKDSKENENKENEPDENVNTLGSAEPVDPASPKNSDTGSESSETPATPTRNDDITASTGSPFKSPRKSSPSKSFDASSKPTRSLLKNPSSPKGTRHIRFACVREYVFPRQQVCFYQHLNCKQLLDMKCPLNDFSHFAHCHQQEVVPLEWIQFIKISILYHYLNIENVSIQNGARKFDTGEGNNER